MCLCGWIQYSFQTSSGDISLAANEDEIILKFRSVNCLSIIRPLKQLSKVSAVSFSRIFVRIFFCKLLSKYLWQSLYNVKFHAFSIFFWTTLDRFVWSVRIILWDASYFRHSNNIHTARASLQKLLKELQQNEGCKSYLGNKEQKWTFLNLSWSDMHIGFDFARPFFCVPDRALVQPSYYCAKVSL